MASFSATDVKKLRDATAAGMMDCKRALEEADGDFDKAVEVLRVKGQRGVTKREGRSASNGLVMAKLDGTSEGVLLELNCETDFVAKGERFQQVAGQVLDHVVATRPDDVDALLASDIEPGKTVQELLDDANAMIGEKVQLRRFAAFSGGYVASYLHRTNPDLPPQIGVLVQLSGKDDAGDTARDLAQHIAAFAPTYLSREDVPEEIVENERRIAEETARTEGKPEQAVPRIVEGRVNGFFKDSVLLEQAFARDNKKTVAAVLKEAGVELTRFVRFRVGS
jgi:elongation factor Ts